MTNSSEKRNYQRVSPGVNFSVMASQHLNKNDREYYEGLIENISHKGVFIEIAHPFPIGCIVTIEFKSEIEKNERPIKARGLVSWSRKWRKPHGMGIDFIEFEGLGTTPLEEWFNKHFQQQ